MLTADVFQRAPARFLARSTITATTASNTPVNIIKILLKPSGCVISAATAIGARERRPTRPTAPAQPEPKARKRTG